MVSHTYPARLEEIAVISAAVLSAVEPYQLDAKMRFHIELAIDEACTNIVEHAYADVEGGEIVMSLEIIEGVLRLSFRDTGVPLDDPSGGGAIPADSSIEDVAVGGLGIHMMRSVMDEVVYGKDEDGNVITLMKNLT